MIIYFSGTGNSRYIAERLGVLNKDTVINANDYIKNRKRADLKSNKPFVFVCPTYGWRIPHIFADFIEKGSFQGNKTAYFVMNCGSDIGNAGAYLEKLCNQIHFQYKGVAELVMPENYIAIYDVPSIEEAEQIIKNADKMIPDLAAIIREGKEFPKGKINLAAKLKSGIVNSLYYALIVKAKGFHVTDQCIGCGKCEKLCPYNNIRLEDKKPVWSNQCTHCMACISTCPTEAIEYKKTSVGKRRYFNDKKCLQDK